MNKCLTQLSRLIDGLALLLFLMGYMLKCAFTPRRKTEGTQ